MGFWLRSSVTAGLVLAVSMSLVFCPCSSEASDHSGCGSSATGIQELRGECCDEGVTNGALLTFLAPFAPLLDANPSPALVPAGEVRSGISHFDSFHARPLVLRI